MMHPRHTCLTLPWPTPWGELFGAERPLIVEIGFGNGDYLVALAEHFPDHNVIGFEIANKSLEKAESKIRHRGLHNALAVYSRGETALHHLFTPQSVSQFHLNHPDPWFKNRHTRRRIIQRDTLAALTSRLSPGGLLYLATDVRAYAEMSAAILSAAPGLENTLPDPWVYELSERLVTTKYEQKGYREGRPDHFFRYRRTDEPVAHLPVIEEAPVPHAVIHTPMDPHDITNAVRRTRLTLPDGILVSLIDGYVNPRYGTVLLEVQIVEPTIEQHVGLQLLKRRSKPGEHTLRYAQIGMPRPTVGMHYATGFVAQWIVSLHPEAHILSHKVRGFDEIRLDTSEDASDEEIAQTGESPSDQ